jgi:hypothetical protein
LGSVFNKVRLTFLPLHHRITHKVHAVSHYFDSTSKR